MLYPCLTDYAVSNERVNMMKIHVQQDGIFNLFPAFVFMCQ